MTENGPKSVAHDPMSSSRGFLNTGPSRGNACLSVAGRVIIGV